MGRWAEEQLDSLQNSAFPKRVPRRSLRADALDMLAVTDGMPWD